VAKVLAEVADELATELRSAGVALGVDVPPESAVAVAPNHLATILRNLLGNAVKYGGGRDGARVTVHAAHATGHLRIQVADNGPGIPADALPRVFEPFVRAPSSRPGTGLGLATVKRLVEAHDGAVRISSEPGRGTVVEMELPTPAASGGESEPDAAGFRM
jgi:signal transduction histidine kinase